MGIWGLYRVVSRLFSILVFHIILHVDRKGSDCHTNHNLHNIRVLRPSVLFNCSGYYQDHRYSDIEAPTISSTTKIHIIFRPRYNKKSPRGIPSLFHIPHSFAAKSAKFTKDNEKEQQNKGMITKKNARKKVHNINYHLSRTTNSTSGSNPKHRQFINN